MLYDLVKKYHIKKPLFICYFIAIAVTFYFFFVTIFGQKGLLHYYSLKNELHDKVANKEELLEVMTKKEQLIKAMSSENLDIDLLDEQVKKNLGYVSKQEVVIYDTPN